MEIERKFLVDEPPKELERYPCKRIEQAYIATEPVIRVRRAGERYVLTCKGRGLLAREEHELPLTESAYRRLLTKAEGTTIAKDRYCIPCGEYTIELDVFDAPFAPLMLAEVEFPTEDSKANFLRYIRQESEFDTGIVPQVQDRILTLSTCYGTANEFRWVVQARLRMVPV